ncbi:hypothetical protein PoB_007012000 [Plakobranchus ocellatus]|uniref:Uncharacterized protein n=1 Tax=Plakobranchus ocellatus TaxID=259542 RepID=A0AAV4DHK4_9GAST|nr:hypothetical protein PoB_007012000 [Plakobranchus ocellatus]
MDVITVIMNLVEDYVLDAADLKTLLLTVAHILEAHEKYGHGITKGKAYDQLVELLTTSQDEELFKTIKYIFTLCKAKVVCDIRGVCGTVASESALRSAGTLLSRVRAPPPAPWPDGGPESLRSPCCGLALYKKPNQEFMAAVNEKLEALSAQLHGREVSTSKNYLECDCMINRDRPGSNAVSEISNESMQYKPPLAYKEKPIKYPKYDEARANFSHGFLNKKSQRIHEDEECCRSCPEDHALAKSYSYSDKTDRGFCSQLVPKSKSFHRSSDANTPIQADKHIQPKNCRLNEMNSNFERKRHQIYKEQWLSNTTDRVAESHQSCQRPSDSCIYSYGSGSNIHENHSRHIYADNQNDRTKFSCSNFKMPQHFVKDVDSNNKGEHSDKIPQLSSNSMQTHWIETNPHHNQSINRGPNPESDRYHQDKNNYSPISSQSNEDLGNKSSHVLIQDRSPPEQEPDVSGRNEGPHDPSDSNSFYPHGKLLDINKNVNDSTSRNPQEKIDSHDDHNQRYAIQESQLQILNHFQKVVSSLLTFIPGAAQIHRKSTGDSNLEQPEQTVLPSQQQGIFSCSNESTLNTDLHSCFTKVLEEKKNFLPITSIKCSSKEGYTTSSQDDLSLCFLHDRDDQNKENISTGLRTSEKSKFSISSESDNHNDNADAKGNEYVNHNLSDSYQEKCIAEEFNFSNSQNHNAQKSSEQNATQNLYHRISHKKIPDHGESVFVRPSLPLQQVCDGSNSRKRQISNIRHAGNRFRGHINTASSNCINKINSFYNVNHDFLKQPPPSPALSEFDLDLKNIAKHGKSLPITKPLKVSTHSAIVTPSKMSVKDFMRSKDSKTVGVFYLDALDKPSHSSTSGFGSMNSDSHEAKHGTSSLSGYAMVGRKNAPLHDPTMRVATTPHPVHGSLSHRSRQVSTIGDPHRSMQRLSKEVENLGGGGKPVKEKIDFMPVPQHVISCQIH